jgi:GDPmannose 4,6-dehydratase
VIATGETHSVREFAEVVFAHLGLDHQRYVQIDPRYFRPSEVDLLLGDASKARRELDWSPKVGFRELAVMMTEADLELARREKLLADHSVAPGSNHSVAPVSDRWSLAGRAVPAVSCQRP